ncbi:unnamed protein product [Lathyrus oleraceus]
MNIHRRFLWGGVKGEFKIVWVKWMDVCKPNKLGGLGVCDLRLINLALLGKWKWRLLLGASGISCDILTARYGVVYTTSILGGRAGCLQLSSPWLRGMSLVIARVSDTIECFRDCLSFKFGYGLITSFWEDIWVGVSPICLRFPRFF